MSVIESIDGKEHASIRAYLFGCRYPNTQTSWQVDPMPLLAELRYKLDRIVGLSYLTIKMVNARKSLHKDLEIHIDGVTYNGSDRLNSVDLDALRLTLTNKVNEISGFTFERLDIVSDRFLENPSRNYRDVSMEKVN